jgi:hypothetical protein
MTQLAENVNEERSKDFLALFPEDRRSWVMQRFLVVVRAGECDLAMVVSRVLAASHEKALILCRDQERTKHLGLCLAIEDHPLEALALAQHCLWWESLPAEDRARLKAESSNRHREGWMSKQPATQRQVIYLQQLGFLGPVGDRQTASEEISKRLAGGGS